MDELYPRLLSLTLLAKKYDIGLNIDMRELAARLHTLLRRVAGRSVNLIERAEVILTVVDGPMLTWTKRPAAASSSARSSRPPGAARCAGGQPVRAGQMA